MRAHERGGLDISHKDSGPFLAGDWVQGQGLGLLVCQVSCSQSHWLFRERAVVELRRAGK